jgi:hypothetical protein
MDLFSQRNASHKKVRSRINQDRHAFFEWQFIVARGPALGKWGKTLPAHDVAKAPSPAGRRFSAVISGGYPDLAQGLDRLCASRTGADT